MLHLEFTTGNSNSNPLEIAVILNSLSGVLMWLFFIVVIIVIGLKLRYIKKKNASGRKHSK